MKRGKNKYFNVGMYLDGKSWAKDVRIVRLPSNAELTGAAPHGQQPKPQEVEK